MLKFRIEKKNTGIGEMICKFYGENVDSGFYREHPILKNKAVVNKYGTFHLDSLEEFGVIKVRKKERQIA